MTRAPRDEETEAPSQANRDNPFIKFKNGIDESVSSILQGLVGLPSALSRNQSGNPRWADFDDDLRRRDELQARQKQMKDSEDGRLAQRDTTATTAADMQRVSSRHPEPFSDKDLDPPLYSPFYDSHMRDPTSSDSKNNTTGNSKYWGDIVSLQNAIFNHPFKASFRSEESLLPYLLFSPYSPLKLQTDINGPNYCEAFEDLIRYSHGQKMGSPVAGTFLYTESLQHSPSYSRFGLSWISHLNGDELLQPPHPTNAPYSSSKIIAQLQSKNAAQEAKDEPKTEQDMYDRFLRLASLPTGSEAAGILENLFADIEKEFPGTKGEGERALRWIFDELKSLQPESEKAVRSLAEEILIGVPRSLEQMIKTAREAAQQEFDKNPPSSQREQSFDFPAMSPQAMQGRSRHFREEGDQNLDKVVSTQTNSSRETREDGSVETSVTVWRRFADGRETITTTSHLEEPFRDEVSKSVQQPQQREESVQDKKSEKKGWFWM